MNKDLRKKISSGEVRMLERLEHSRFTEKAERKLKDPAAIRQIKKMAIALSRKVKQSGVMVKRLVDYLVNGKDKGLKVLALASLIYFISPLDFIPDVIPFVGFTDDLSLMGIVITLLAHFLAEPVDVEENERKTKNTKFLSDRSSEVKAAVPVQNTRKISPVHELWGHIFHKVNRDMKTAAEEQVWIRIKGQLLIVIISLGGMIIAAGVILILKKVFFR